MNGVPDQPELLLRERAWLQALARQLVQRHEAADELAHDALASACTQPAPLTAGPRAWLAAILRKQVASSRRAAQRRSAREALAARPEAVPPTDDTIARFEVQRDVANAVLALAEPYRTTVLLRFWEELPPRAIGTRMAVPVETVRTRLKRGLALLRERLDRAHGGDRRAWAVPLWAAGRKAGSVASFLAGVSIMTAMQKLVLGGAVLAAAALLSIAVPWVFAAPASVPESQPAPSPVSVGLPPAAVAEPHALGQGNERVAVTSAETEAQLVVTGTVVDDETSAPLQGALVRLTGSNPAESLGIESPTGADGTFRLQEAQLPAHDGRRVIVQLDDYALAHDFARFDRKQTGPQRVDVGIRLVRGTVFSGQVVDQEGRGVADAELFLALWTLGYGGWPQNLLQESVSVGRGDTAGRFRLDHPVGPDFQHQNLLFAVTPQGMGWCRFEASKQRREVSDLVIRLRPVGGVRVRVIDRDGKPVAGAEVRAFPRFGPIGIAGREWRTEPSPHPAIRAHFSGRTDASGMLRLNLPVGEPGPLGRMDRDERLYDLSVEASGHPRQPLHPLDLKPGTEQEVTVSLVEAQSIIVAVDVHDDLGAPVANAAVSAGETQLVNGRTDAAGHAELTVPATSRIHVSGEAPGHRNAQEQLTVASAAPLRVSLTLARTRPLDGRVVDQFGAPIAGMAVFVGHTHLCDTDAEGRFHADACPVGEREIAVAMAPKMDSSRWTGEQTPQTLDAERGPVTITMQRRTGHIDVRVAIVDARSGQTLEPTETFLGLFTEETRGFHIRKLHESSQGVVVAKDCAAGRWRLSVRTASGQRGALDFVLTEGQPPAELRLELPAPGAVTGRLRFVDVEPPREVTVHVQHQKPDPTAWTSFVFPGRWQVDATSQTTIGAENGQWGSLRMQPARNPVFRLESADPTDTIVFIVIGDGVRGEANARVEPGQARDVVVEVHKKAQPR
ncbi:MAG TPA: sigma-70 family RNA polymerase sigma factor [Planctomycetota bacterium]|nr:sigma-70 family RNA polymerase sigma factor [Planctomycetota bacterium]